jgi:ABC-type transporter Mla subunit MlaD
MSASETSSTNIAKIVKTINEIAFQTNLLALNAAVEAARAGQAGMGFAVVADEVRTLAQHSAEAARETAEKISESIANTKRGAVLTRQVVTHLQEVVAKTRQVDQLVADIATASREQDMGIAQISQAINQVDLVTQQNAASAQESAGAAEELRVQANSLRQAIEKLRRLTHGENTILNPAAATVVPTLQRRPDDKAGCFPRPSAAACATIGTGSCAASLQGGARGRDHDRAEMHAQHLIH